MKAGWWDAPLGLGLLDLAEAIRTILNSLCFLYPSINIRKRRWNLALTLRRPSFDKTWNTKVRLQLALKLLLAPCHYPPPTIKVLETTKISKLFLLSLSPMILNDHWSPHTLNHTIPSPQESPGGTWTRSFSIPLLPIKSPNARFLNHHK